MSFDLLFDILKALLQVLQVLKEGAFHFPGVGWYLLQGFDPVFLHLGHG